jgi:hypothetical protein
MAEANKNDQLTHVHFRMKAILFTIVRAFEFELAVPARDVIKKTSIVQRPALATDPNGDSQMPLLIKLHNRPT